MSPRKTARPTSIRIDPDTEVLAEALVERRRLKSLSELVRVLVDEEAERKRIGVTAAIEARKGRK